MSIVLTILKILGIILGILLAVVLALLFLILFLPVCYRIGGNIQEEALIQGRASWLFSLIQMKFTVHGKEMKAWISILGFKKFLYPKTEKRQEEKKGRKQFHKIEVEKEENIKAEKTVEDSKDSEKEEVSTQEEPLTGSSKKERKRKPRKSLQKYLPWNIIKTWTAKRKGTLEKRKENFENIKKEFSDETNKNAVSHIWEEVKRVLWHIGPRRGKADLHYSLGDPAYTGQMTGALSLVPLFYKKGIAVIPDFASDKPYVRGSFRINGHIQVFPFLGVAFRVFTDKNIRKLIQKFK